MPTPTPTIQQAGPGPAPPVGNRLFRLRAFEILIFVMLFVLLALCLAVSPAITGDRPGAVGIAIRDSWARP